MKLENSDYLASRFLVKLQSYFSERTHIDQWYRLDRPKINPHSKGQLPFLNNGAKTVSQRKDSLFSK